MPQIESWVQIMWQNFALWNSFVVVVESLNFLFKKSLKKRNLQKKFWYYLVLWLFHQDAKIRHKKNSVSWLPPKKGLGGGSSLFPLSMRRRQHWRSRKRPVAQAVRPSVSPVRREGRREAAPAARIWASREHRRSRSGIQTPERAPWEQTIMESGQKQRHATCKYVSIVATRTWSVDQWCHRPRAGGREGGGHLDPGACKLLAGPRDCWIVSYFLLWISTMCMQIKS